MHLQQCEPKEGLHVRFYHDEDIKLKQDVIDLGSMKIANRRYTSGKSQETRRKQDYVCGTVTFIALY